MSNDKDFGRKARELFGACGLLVALFVAATSSGCAALRKDVKAVEKDVPTVIAAARAVADKDCPKAAALCSTYFSAVKSGLVKDDDRAELACAKSASVCGLVEDGEAGAPAQ